jgi:hypothetical protein
MVPVQLTTPVYIVQAPPPPPRSGRGLIAAVLLAALFTMCCIGGATLAYVGHNARPKGSFGPATTSRLNEPVQDDMFEFVVASMTCGRASISRDYQSRSAHGQFCLMELTIRNTGSRVQTFVDSFQRAIGPDGESYQTDTAAGLLANGAGASPFVQVKPGNQVTSTIVFDIPAGASITTVELHENPVSHGATVQVA